MRQNVVFPMLLLLGMMVGVVRAQEADAAGVSIASVINTDPAAPPTPLPPQIKTTIQVGPDSEVTALEQAMAKARSGTAVQFARGSVFTTRRPWKLPADVVIEDYGDPTLPPPLLVYIGPGNDRHNGLPALLHITRARNIIRNVELAAADDSRPCIAIALQGSSTVIDNVDFRARSFRNVIMTSEGHQPGKANKAATDCIIRNCRSPESEAYFVYACPGTRRLLISHNIARAARGHVLRFHVYPGGGDIAIVANELTQPVTDPGRLRATINLRDGENFYIAHNTLRGGQFILGPLKQDTDKWLRSVLVEHNAILEGRQNQLFEGAEDLIIRHNRIQMTTNAPFSCEASETERPDPHGLIAGNATQSDSEHFISGSRTTRLDFRGQGNTHNGMLVE